MSLPFVEVHVRLLDPSQGKKGEENVMDTSAEEVEEAGLSGEVSEDAIDVDVISVIKS